MSWTTILGEDFERQRDNRWRRRDGRVVLIMDLEDSAGGEFPWRIQVDGEYVMTNAGTHPRRYSHPWNAIRDAQTRMDGRTIQ